MGFRDKFKKVFGSGNKKDVGNDNFDEEIIDKPVHIESLEDEHLNANEETQSSNSKHNYIDDENGDEPTQIEQIRNFEYLDDLIHSSSKEIVLDADIVLDTFEVSEYLEGIKLDVDDLVIDGNGHVIDACRQTRIFHCTGKNITIKNITLKNGSSLCGGAIHNSGELAIIQSVLTQNTSTKENHLDRGGGAIFNEGVLLMEKSTLNKNMSSCSAGAIFSNNGKLTIKKSTLLDNRATYNGGAIYVSGESVITESAIIQNTAESEGGAIINKGTLTITGSEINENTSQIHAGAIYNHYKLSITESFLKDNTARYGGALCNSVHELNIKKSEINCNRAEVGGGAVHNYSGDVTIEESLLSENKAEEKGSIIYNNRDTFIIKKSVINESRAEGVLGAIHNDGILKLFDCEIADIHSLKNIIYNENSLEVFNSNFNDNNAKNIIFNEGDGSNLGIFNGKFIDNDAGESVIVNSGEFCTIEKSIFENNNSLNNIVNHNELTLKKPILNDEGKTILNEGKILIKDECQNFINQIYGEGKVNLEMNLIPDGETFDFGYLDKKIHENSSKEIILDEDICLEDYEKDFYEGGIELDIDDLVIDGRGHIIDGADRSRMFVIMGNNITLKNITFKNGFSHKNYDAPLNEYGGAIKGNHEISLTIENCKFINNTSKSSGGAIYITNSILTIYNTTFEENTAYTGGAIYIDGGTLTIDESNFESNTGKSFAGAMYNVNASLTINECVFNNNDANYAGAIYNYGILSICKSTFNENSAQEWGGAIENDSKLTISDSTLENNSANLCGTMMISTDDENEFLKVPSELALQLGDSRIISKGDFSGAIYNGDNSSFNIENCRLNNNKPRDFN